MQFMKPGGSMYPSHAAMYMAPIRTHVAQQRVNEFQGSMEGWAEFIHEMQDFYQVRTARGRVYSTCGMCSAYVLLCVVRKG